MELYIGGCYQGKLAYVLEKKKWNGIEILSGEYISWEKLESCQVCDHFHDFLRKELNYYTSEKEAQIEVIKRLEDVFKKNPSLLVICDEVGMGVVPMERQERDYRELVGRVCVYLAKNASHVERIVAGMGQILK
ncbi:MAG: bifunctional adenosylcobinamide kinase/adenosylcobinamide-phosphate guanylyltransferase [Eubacteriales bacterium]